MIGMTLYFFCIETPQNITVEKQLNCRRRVLNLFAVFNREPFEKSKTLIIFFTFEEKNM